MEAYEIKTYDISFNEKQNIDKALNEIPLIEGEVPYKRIIAFKETPENNKSLVLLARGGRINGYCVMSFDTLRNKLYSGLYDMDFNSAINAFLGRIDK